MNKELQNKLKEKYPNLAVSIDCEDGWFTILETLLEQLSNVEEYEKVKLKIVQIKQKFGGLRVYVRFNENTPVEIIEHVRGLTQMAESMSYKICEYCGTTKNIGRSHGFIVTCCDECFSKGLTKQNEWSNEFTNIKIQ